MKRLVIGCLALLFTLASCATVHTTGNGKIPPGQAKKITGQKSARDHAPGQQKDKGGKGHQLMP